MARALGYGRVESCRCDWTTASRDRPSDRAPSLARYGTRRPIFYRLRILRTYQRKRAMVGIRRPRSRRAARRPSSPRTASPSGSTTHGSRSPPEDVAGARRELRSSLSSSLGARPAGQLGECGNPVLCGARRCGCRRPEIAPTDIPTPTGNRGCSPRISTGRGVAAVASSAGNVRVVVDHAVRQHRRAKHDYQSAIADRGIGPEHLVSWLSERGGRRCTHRTRRSRRRPRPSSGPTSVEPSATPGRGALLRARSHGASLSLARRSRSPRCARSARGSCLAGGPWRMSGWALAPSLCARLSPEAGLLAGLHFRSIAVGAPDALCGRSRTQAAYTVGFVQGLLAVRG